MKNMLIYLSYEEMFKKEIEIINKITNINDSNMINKKMLKFKETFINN